MAFAKIPAFIVTLGGMLIFRGLTGNMLPGQFVGPFDRQFQNISKGFLPGSHSSDGEFPLPTSMLIGVVVPPRCSCIFSSWRAAGRRSRWTRETEPFAFFVEEPGLRRPDHRHHLPARLLQGPAERARDHGRADPVLHFRDHAHDDRSAHLRARRQRAGGAALGHPDRAARPSSPSSIWACSRASPA